MRATEEQIKQLKDTGVKVENTDIDVRDYLSNPIFRNSKPGEKEYGDHLHFLLRGQPGTIGFYLLADGRLALTDEELDASTDEVVEFSLAVFDAGKLPYDVCDCGGEYVEQDGVYICDKCNALHSDFE